jgi:hypothetical protein
MAITGAKSFTNEAGADAPIASIKGARAIMATRQEPADSLDRPLTTGSAPCRLI